MILCSTFWIGGAAAGQDAHGFGPVVPVVLPDIVATRHDGAQVRLRDVFAGRRTALQFIFVDCTTACPLLGSLFRKVDQALGSTDAQLVSITVNPERDTAARMGEWMQRFHAGPRWIGLHVDAAFLPELLRVFKQEAGPPSGHTLQVFLVDDKARYVARTVDLPSAAAVAEELRLGSDWETRLGVESRPAVALAGRDVYEGRGNVIGMIGEDRLAPQASACSGCHGPAGIGGGEGKTTVPPLTRESLTSLQTRRGGPPSAYTEESFCKGLRTRLDPSGVPYSNVMPRYRIDGRTCHQLWGFLTGAQ